MNAHGFAKFLKVVMPELIGVAEMLYRVLPDPAAAIVRLRNARLAMEPEADDLTRTERPSAPGDA